MKLRNFIMIFWCLTLSATGHGQLMGPRVWTFGRNAGLNFTGGLPAPVSYPIENCYSPASTQCDRAGNLLFYSDGRTIRNRNGEAMLNSDNPVWPAPVSTSMYIITNIVPVIGDTNRYYVFTLTPSSGASALGTYYYGVLTYRIVDMRLNNGLGGIDPAVNSTMLATDLDMDMIVIPGDNCDFWLAVYEKGNQQSRFITYRITEEGILGPVYSPITLPGTRYPYGLMKMVYSYKHHKILARIGPQMITSQDFDPASGTISNGQKILDFAEFRNQGGGATLPSFCLSGNEQFLYLLGYIVTQQTPTIKLQQYAIDLSLAVPAMGASTTIFQSTDALYQVPATSLPIASQNCDIRRGPDNKVYLFFNTGMSFLGQVGAPDNAGTACNFVPQAVSLLPNTFGSFYFPAISNDAPEIKVNYKVHDTTLCFAEPYLLRTDRNGTHYTFLWSNGSTAAEITADKPGIYWVKSTGDCYEPQQVDTFILKAGKQEHCNCQLFVPNAFSPNKDGLNDRFRPYVSATCIGGSYVMTIYNRWGASVFHSYDIFKGWDGMTGNAVADLGVYYYTISYRDPKNNTVNRKGSFTLLR